MTKVMSELRKHIKLILISAAVIAFIVIFAILNTESAIEIGYLFGVSAKFTVRAIGVALVLAIPSIIYKAVKRKTVKLKGFVRTLLVLLFIVLVVGTYIVLDMIPYLGGSPDSKTAEYPSINSVEYKMTLPQAFSEKPAEMLFGYFSYILYFIILAFAGNLMILTWENHENVSAKIFKVLTGVIFAVIINCVVVLLDYLSTMLTLNFFTTVGPLAILGIYIGYGVYGKIQDSKDRKLRAKGL
ncbi:MAG: hypothetical protein IKU30_01625 [Clostridia bacterium]|nr:hypothetical protein [Clostridia bacterium]